MSSRAKKMTSHFVMETSDPVSCQGLEEACEAAACAPHLPARAPPPPPLATATAFATRSSRCGVLCLLWPTGGGGGGASGKECAAHGNRLLGTQRCRVCNTLTSHWSKTNLGLERARQSAEGCTRPHPICRGPGRVEDLQKHFRMAPDASIERIRSTVKAKFLEGKP